MGNKYGKYKVVHNNMGGVFSTPKELKGLVVPICNANKNFILIKICLLKKFQSLISK